ncbi:Serine-threonine protein kinase, plant-type [Theobroma cacao]|uniref:Serine-threonine protein kinase, plant-type n=1 Tax=Theobroma cacao TaxID=3641 RepID=A0A061ENI0_THECC|nr:Serine-threonine protein kinase, plant-type [Theobroma cacao]
MPISWLLGRPDNFGHNTLTQYEKTWVKQLFVTNPLFTPDTHASPAEYEDFERSKLRGIPIPNFLGSIESLRYLSLSRAGFKGLAPHRLGNLSSLKTLNLANDEGYLYVANLQWLSVLSLLEHLDLSNVNLTKVSNSLKVLNTLPFLQKLYLSGCQLPQP